MRTPRQIRLLSWPFRSVLASPVWLVLRFYLASVWLQFGIGKIRGGWLNGDALHGLLGAVAAGHTPAPVPAYARVAELLVATGLDRVLSVLIPLTEVAVAAAFVSGVLLVPAAIAATLLNLNLILSGIASIHFDGRIIALQVLLLLAWRVAGYLGLGTLATRWWHHHHHPRGPLAGGGMA
jgi:thiosulfate dehydrogenase (quinone) large subunit